MAESGEPSYSLRDESTILLNMVGLVGTGQRPRCPYAYMYGMIRVRIPGLIPIPILYSIGLDRTQNGNKISYRKPRFRSNKPIPRNWTFSMRRFDWFGLDDRFPVEYSDLAIEELIIENLISSGINRSQMSRIIEIVLRLESGPSFLSAPSGMVPIWFYFLQPAENSKNWLPRDR